MKTQKGFAGDLIVLFVMVFVIVLLYIVGTYLMGSINTGIPNFDNQISNTRNGLLGFDSLAPLFIIGMAVALICSSFLVKTMPALFFFFLIIQLITSYIALQFSNAYIQLLTNNPLSVTAALFNNWLYVFQYLPIISVILSIIFAIAVYAKG